MAHIENMSSATIHLAHQANSEDAELQLSAIPLSDPAEILRQLPAQALSPALLELLDLMASPILLIKHSPTGELRETAPAKPVLQIGR